MKLIEQIRQAERTLETRLAQEKQDAEEAQKKLDDEDRLEGAKRAKTDIKEISNKILCAVDDQLKFYVHPIGRGRDKPMTPFEEGYSNYLIQHYLSEGVQAVLTKTPLRRNTPAGPSTSHDYNIRFSWDIE